MITPYDWNTTRPVNNPDKGIMWGLKWREVAMLQDEELLYRYQEIIHREWKPKQGRGRPARIPLKGDMLPVVHKKLNWKLWDSMPYGTLQRSKIPA